MDKYMERFHHSSPDTRNMDTMLRQAAGLRKRADDPEYIEYVATNMERIAEDYANVYEKMIEARAILLKFRDITADYFGIKVDYEDDKTD